MNEPSDLRQVMESLEAEVIRLRAEHAKLRAVLKEHQELQRTYHGGDLTLQVVRAFNHYRDQATNHLTGSKTLVQDVQVWLRAFAMTLEMVADGATHAEKAARLRGLIGMVESSIEKLRNWDVDFAFTHYHEPDLFKSDYPVYEFVRRIRELEARNKALEERLAAGGAAGDEGSPV